MKTGAQVVGTSPTRLVHFSLPIRGELRVRAAGANSAKVYVGFSSGVTAATDLGQDGYELSAGVEMVIPPAQAGDATNVWVVSTAGSQRVYWFGLTPDTTLGWALSFYTAHDSGYLPLFF